MRTIYKYNLNLLKNSQDYYDIKVPENSTYLDCQVQSNDISIWFCIETSESTSEIHRFYIQATGQELNGGIARSSYLKTVQLYDGKLVLHIFNGGIYESKN